MIRLTALALMASTQTLSAAPCTEFEQSVYGLIQEAQTFQRSASFQQYGWAANGPTNGWLDRWRNVRDMDRELHLQFMRKFGYVPGDLYAVADAYRTGSFDSYYADTEKMMTEGPICD